MKKHAVAIASTGSGAYPAAPFHPPNSVYTAVEEALAQLGLDAGRLGTADWNPFGFIPKGSRVLLKPNLVRHFHPYGYSTDVLYTHGSVIRAVCDYVLKALAGTGEVVIADAPLQTCDFKAVTGLAGVTALVEHYRSSGQTVSVRDLRLVRSEVQRGGWLGNVLVKEANSGDPRGYTIVALDRASLHAERDRPGKYRVTCYDPAAMQQYHGEDGRHRYVIANTMLEADVVINLPKVKTHQKAGLTGALKNFVGINGHKDCLPHHVLGAPAQGGDEYAAPSWAKRVDAWLQDFKEIRDSIVIRKAVAVAHQILQPIHMRAPGNAYWAGSWHGNDTISRTTIDLNRIVLYGRKDGTLAETPQRRVFTIADAVLAGEADGPLAPTPKPAGLIVAGENSVAVDLMLARVMGFDWRAISTLRHAVESIGLHPLWDGCAAMAVSANPQWNRLAADSLGPGLAFEPHRGWRGHIEWDAAKQLEVNVAEELNA
jgi:uncharacterized protein (DUF362 family)